MSPRKRAATPKPVDFHDKLLEALSEVDRPGDFCTWGDRPLVRPGLEADRMGVVGLPLTKTHARKLTKLCRQAPYGKGTETVVDTDVRRVWELDPAQFQLTNPKWDEFIASIIDDVKAALGLGRQKLVAHLYKLLVYEKQGIAAPSYESTAAAIGKLLGDWSKGADELRLAVTLDHRYTQAGLSIDKLKGVDRARAEVLFEAAEQADCIAHLALVTLWQCGQAEGGYDDYSDGYGRGRRYHWSDDEDETDFDETTGQHLERWGLLCQVSRVLADNHSNPPSSDANRSRSSDRE